MMDALAAPQIFNVRNAAKDYVKVLGKKEDEALAPEEQQQGASPMQEMADKMKVKAPDMFSPDSIESVLNAQL